MNVVLCISSSASLASPNMLSIFFFRFVFTVHFYNSSLCVAYFINSSNTECTAIRRDTRGTDFLLLEFYSSLALLLTEAAMRNIQIYLHHASFGKESLVK